MKKNEREERPLSYPQPTETDKQLKNQPEFIDNQPNEYDDKTVSDEKAEGSERKEERMRDE